MTLNLRMSIMYKTNTFLLGNSGIIRSLYFLKAPAFLQDTGVENVQTQGKTTLHKYLCKLRAYLKNSSTINGCFQFEVDNLQPIRCAFVYI